MEALYSKILDIPPHYHISHPDFPIEPKQFGKLNKAFQRLASGIPLAYILNEQLFYGLKFFINENVLIPRPETESLVEIALTWISNQNRPIHAVDVGTGSGCIAVSIAANHPKIKFTAIDKYNSAIKIARKNIIRHELGQRIHLIQADLLKGIVGRFDLLIANLPYIPSDRLGNLSVGKHEPISALDGGKNGFQYISEFLEQSRNKLMKNGLILAEIDEFQANIACHLGKIIFPHALVKIKQDLAGKARVLEILN